MPVLRSPLSAAVSATRRHIRLRKLASSTDVWSDDPGPEMAEKRAIRFAHLGADPLRRHVIGLSQLDGDEAVYVAQTSAAMEAVSVNECGCHSSYATTKLRDHYASASVACMRR